MKSQIIIFILLIGSKGLTATYKCACTELIEQDDCGNYSSCLWDATNSKCTVKATSTRCADYKVQSYCDADYECAWTNAGACDAFTKCLDYIITSSADAAQCYLKDPTCVPGTASGTIVPCTTGTGTVICSDVKDQNVCNSLQPTATTICYWSTTCIIHDVSQKCATITDELLCISMRCLFTNGKCEVPTCASITIQSLCTYLRADDIESVQICTWANDVCSDAVDTLALKSTNCFKNTGGTHKWDGSACVPCSTTQCPDSISGQVYNESLVIGNNSEPFIYYHQILILEQKMEKCEPTNKIINATLYLVQDNQKKQLQIKKANLDISGKASFEIYIENFWRNFSFLIEAVTDKLNYTLKSTTFDCVALSKENFNCPTCQQQCEETGINELGCGSCVPEEYSFTTHLFCVVYFILLISL